MTFLTMDYFLMVAEKKSFTQAAEALHITQQTLSAHIAGLEKELDCKLFIRHVPLELTYAGETFLRYAQSFRKKYESMQHEFSDMACSSRGVLRIGISPTRGLAVMPEIIAAYKKQYPLMEIQVLENGNDVLQEDLMNREIDLAIAHFPGKVPGITLHDFYEEEVVLVIAEALFQELFQDQAETIASNVLFPEHIQAFERCPFLLNRESDIAGRIARNFIRLGDFTPDIQTQSGNMGLLLRLCADGLGACFCPENLIAVSLSETAQTKMRIIRLGQSAKYKISFGWLEQPYQWNAIEAFMETARSAIFRKSDG